MRKHLVIAFVSFALGLLLVVLIPFGIVSAHGHLRSFVDDQLSDTQHVAATIARASAPYPFLVERYAGSRTAGWLLDESGTPIGNATEPRAFPAVVTRAPEVEAARGGTTSTRTSDSPLDRRLLIAAPIIREGRLDGVLWVSDSLAPVAREDRETWAQLAAIGAVVMVIAAGVGIAISRRLARRIEIVAGGAQRFAQGRLSEPIIVEGSDEITALAGTLNNMGSEIDRLVHREKDFVAAASHQIRTPLAAIKIRIDELLAIGGTLDTDEGAYLKEMAEEVDRLTMLTTRLLDLSSAEATHDARALLAGHAVRQAIDRIEPLAHHLGIALELGVEDDATMVMAPPGAFEEALFNVLDNAVKFSPPGNAVAVRARKDNGSYLVEVADRGPGIPEEQRARVLEPFYRATRAKTGYGLGLAISARLCLSAGATLSLERREGGGTLARIGWPTGERP